MTNRDKLKQDDCSCYNDIVLVKKAHWVCGKCMKDLSHEIAMMSESTYNKIKGKIRMGVNYYSEPTEKHIHSTNGMGKDCSICDSISNQPNYD